MKETRDINQHLQSTWCANLQNLSLNPIRAIRSCRLSQYSVVLGLSCLTSFGLIPTRAVAYQEFSVPIDSESYDTPAYTPEPPATEYYESEPYYSEPATESYQAPVDNYYSEPDYYSEPAPEPYYPAEDYYSEPAPEPYYEEPAVSEPPVSEDYYYAEPQELEIPSVVPPPSQPLELPAKQVTTPQLKKPLVPGQDSVAQPPAIYPQAENSNVDVPNSFIDPTEYNIGATGGYESPSTVIFSERSTGCEVVVGVGQSVDGLCATASEPLGIPNGNSYAGGNTGGGVDNIYVNSGNAYATSSGNYSGGNTWQAQPAAPSWYGSSPTQVPVAGLSPIRVGPVNVSAMSNSGMAYYNRTMRPPAVSGNGDTNMLFPLSIPAPITSLFGWRNHPVLGTNRFHTGMDIGADTGTPVVATYSGQVSIADWLGGYGLTVVLDHRNKSKETLYGHMSELFVRPGEWVEQGEVIGRVGNTGMSTGPHLHFELRKLTNQGWVAINPQNEMEFALAQLLNTLRSAAVPPEAFILTLPDKTTDPATGIPKLPPLPPGMEITIHNFEPPTLNFGYAENVNEQG